MSDKLILWGQRAALTLAAAYAGFLIFAGPIATIVPSFSEPARFLGEDAEPTRFHIGGDISPGGFLFEATMTSVAFDRAADRLGAPSALDAPPLCRDLNSKSQPKFALPYQCARWDGLDLVLEQKMSADDDPVRLIQRLSHSNGQLVWTLTTQ
ncbi:MAG: hypothetical protein AAGF71_00280 [Pseudomonadota bacterium]